MAGDDKTTDLPRLTVSTGDQGTGKSHRSNAVAAALLSSGQASRLVALDIGSADGEHDVPKGPLAVYMASAGLETYVVSTEDGIRRGLERGYRVIVLRPDSSLTTKPRAPYRDAANAIARQTIGDYKPQTEVAREESIAIAWSETHLAMPNNGPEPTTEMVQAATRARHNGVYVIAETQHVARLSTLLRDEGRWYVHRTASRRDIEAIADYVEGQADFDKKAVFAAMRALQKKDEPGWHLLIEGSNTTLEPMR